ncbi:reverse transcriptase domain-containing protein [Tanacetum coccineum]|uniref:Reverse transcriptase domain-containing protein n=1 Tax=Tanacetum coccineum TaxID=301880 RepID=A0ABQ5H5U3_9ASTR
MIFPPIQNRAPSVYPTLISVLVNGRQVVRVLLDAGAACDIIYEHCFLKLRKEVGERRKDVYTTLSGFYDEQVSPLGEISLQITKYYDRTRIPRTLKIREEIFVTKHKLNEDKKVTPVQQKKRGMAPEQSATTSKEVEELRKARILHETRYQTWVTNTVMVKKTDGSWRMCVDFTDINKACPKDCYSLLEIYWKVDSLFDFKIKCFLYAYKGYHQIQMAKEDEHKTAFHASKGVYCYMKMPFGLKNVGATYQRILDKVFESQIGRNIEAYVDNMVIKSMVEEDMLADIQETFERLRRINMKLNPRKCSFEMEEGQFLGHIVSKQGIKANPTKIQELTSLNPPKTIKEVQSLNGKLAALNRFLSKSAEKSLPFFKTLKGCLEKKDCM